MVLSYYKHLGHRIWLSKKEVFYHYNGWKAYEISFREDNRKKHGLPRLIPKRSIHNKLL